MNTTNPPAPRIRYSISLDILRSFIKRRAYPGLVHAFQVGPGHWGIQCERTVTLYHEPSDVVYYVHEDEPTTIVPMGLGKDLLPMGNHSLIIHASDNDKPRKTNRREVLWRKRYAHLIPLVPAPQVCP